MVNRQAGSGSTLWASAKLKHLKKSRRALSKEGAADKPGSESCRFFDLKMQALRDPEPHHEQAHTGGIKPAATRSMNYRESEDLIARTRRAASAWRKEEQAPMVVSKARPGMVSKALVDRLMVDNLANHLAMAAGDLREPLQGYRAINTGRGRMDVTADRLKHAAGSMFLEGRQQSGGMHKNYDVVSLMAEAMKEEQDTARAIASEAFDLRAMMPPGESWQAMCFDTRACINDSQDTIATFHRLFGS